MRIENLLLKLSKALSFQKFLLLSVFYISFSWFGSFIYLNMAVESEYKLEDVAVTRIASEKIDETFRSSTIGE